MTAEEEAREIAVEAYVYAYPLVLSELTRRVRVGTVPETMNRIQHRREYVDAGFTEVVRPNADTLYSTLWFDVSQEPLAIGVPDSGGRYYLLPMMDLWTDVFAAPGSRTTGNDAQLIVIAAADWQGQVPDGAILLRSPTAVGWMIGRTQTNGPADYRAVHQFQDGIQVCPLSQLGNRAYEAPPLAPSAGHWDLRTPPVVQVEKLDAQEFFAFFAQLLQANPPHANDYAIVHRMARIGLVAGKTFSLAALPPAALRGVAAAPALALEEIKNQLGAGVRSQGWRIRLTAIGTYGTDYRMRAGVAYAGLGALPVEDAVYPLAFADADGKPFASEGRYVLHFDADEIPPARAFWSLTMYDERQLFTPNPIRRYAIGDRDPLNFNADGSLDIYIQQGSPGAERESNWLPAPAAGTFTMNLRVYWPEASLLNGKWLPPAVRRVG